MKQVIIDGAAVAALNDIAGNLNDGLKELAKKVQVGEEGRIICRCLGHSDALGAILERYVEEENKGQASESA